MGSWILIILVIMPGAWSGDWQVTFEDQCALKGSSVVIKCKYDYPFGNIVTSVLWSKVLLVSGIRKLSPLSSLPVPQDHFIYQGNYRGDCSLQVNDVQPFDEGTYYFSFVTTFNRWTSKTPTYLSVEELTTVVQPSTVEEGEKVRLTCVSGCPKPTHVRWFKDGKAVYNTDFVASRKDAGRYYCAVYGQEMVRSAPVPLNVQYPPEKVSLSVSPPGNILQGGAVTFHCRSDANPPVTQSGYRLYKDGQFISSGMSYTISEVQPSHSGHYYCQAWNNISWRGNDRINSTEVHLDVQCKSAYRPMNISISMDPQEVSEGSAVNLTCSSAANPAAYSYTWYKMTPYSSSDNSTMIEVGSGQVLSVLSMETLHIGAYICLVRNMWGEYSSPELLLNMKERQGGLQPVSILAGIGVSLLATLVIILLLFWRNRKNDADKKIVSDTKPTEVTEDPSYSLYANVHTFPSSPSIKSQRNSHFDAAAFYEDEVTYSTVSIKPRNSNLPHYIQQESRSTAGKSDESVIYATVVKSS
ncbi:B-cell receptor CD22-like isoform X2 [Parambassis ranga]|uniref:B-cell receptor CD22-like isoform X2 n=1 Tax=Parambassis ranga TaxID=210632 RepID=A0A6P7JZ56_9TELE|nr:B-cell receptor CD22-like isoform X2 [Parambassis ranga]